jgi:hypothetical protein
MGASDWIVLGVGIATVASLVIAALLLHRFADKLAEAADWLAIAADRQAVAAERQAEAAQAQTRAVVAAEQNELAARLLAKFAGSGPSHYKVRLFNGGRHAASAVSVHLLDEEGESLGAGSLPMLAAGAALSESDALVVPIDSAAAAAAVRRVDLVWIDGRGAQRDRQPI